MICNTREELSKYAHNAWSGWMKYLFSKTEQNEDGSVIIPTWAVERWTRQMNTLYDELSEEEKNSDRDEADKIIKIANGIQRIHSEIRTTGRSV